MDKWKYLWVNSVGLDSWDAGASPSDRIRGNAPTMLNYLGSLGWELVTTPPSLVEDDLLASDQPFVFKRRVS